MSGCEGLLFVCLTLHMNFHGCLKQIYQGEEGGSGMSESLRQQMQPRDTWQATQATDYSKRATLYS
jgi:hypothetical protein